MADNEPDYIDPALPIEFSLTLRAAEGVSATGWLANRKSRRIQAVLAEAVLRRNERVTTTVIPPFGRHLFIRVFVRGPRGSHYRIETELEQPEIKVQAQFELEGSLSERELAEHVTELVGVEAPIQWDSLPAGSGAGYSRRINDDTMKYQSPPPLMERSPEPPPKLKEERRILDYSVWFGTNRTPIFRDDKIIDFGTGRSDVIRFGKCSVAIPESHEFGSLGSSPWRRWWKGIDDRLTVKAIMTADENDFWTEIRDVLKNTVESDKDAIVFLHGYRTTFKDAARRAAQLGADLAFGGVMAFYSWPSKGTFIHYPADSASIEGSEVPITDFLKNIALLSGARKVHIIAHSMGNRGLLRAMDNIASAAQSQSKVRFNQIIIAAADVDLDTFKSLSAAYAALAHRTTMYVCPADIALYVSKFIYRFPRAGFTPPVVVVPGIDTVDVGNVNLSKLGHGYFAEGKELLGDMYELVRNGTPPNARFRLRSEQGPDGIFWKFAK